MNRSKEENGHCGVDLSQYSEYGHYRISKPRCGGFVPASLRHGVGVCRVVQATAELLRNHSHRESGN